MPGPAAVIGVRQLRDEASALIAKVEKGEWFILSKRRNLVGVLLPSSMVARLLEEHAAEVVSLQVERGRGAGR